MSVSTVLHAVFGFDRIFFSVLNDFYGFVVSNRPQCPPRLKSQKKTRCSLQLKKG